MGNSVLFLFKHLLTHVEDGMSLHYIYDIIFQLIMGDQFFTLSYGSSDNFGQIG